MSLQPMDGVAALELNPAIAFTMIDRMLGGSGRRVSADRALTEIEQTVVDAVVKLILEQLSETWAAIVPSGSRSRRARRVRRCFRSPRRTKR